MNHHWWKVYDVDSQPDMHHKLQDVEFESLENRDQAHPEQAMRDNAYLSAHIVDVKVC